jgi:hypothetical protein
MILLGEGSFWIIRLVPSRCRKESERTVMRELWSVVTDRSRKWNCGFVHKHCVIVVSYF